MTFIEWKLGIKTYHDSIIVRGRGQLTFLTVKLFSPNPDEAFLKDLCPILLIQKLIFEEFLKDLCPILLTQNLIVEDFLRIPDEKSIFFIFKILVYFKFLFTSIYILQYVN